MVGLKQLVKGSSQRQSLYMNRRQHAACVAMMFPLAIEISGYLLADALAAGAGKIPFAKQRGCFGLAERLTQPAAGATLDLTGATGHGFLRIEAAQQANVQRTALTFQDVNSIRGDKLVEGARIEAC